MRVLMTNIIALCDEGLYEELLRYVPTERQEKIARCGKRQDRMRSLAAGLLLEYGLRSMGCSLLPLVPETETVHLVCGTHGKPELSGGAGVHFNLSHAGDYAAAVFDEGEVGIDVEQVRRVNVNVMRRQFTAEENAYLLSEPDAFLRLWTRKESYCKAVGEDCTCRFLRLMCWRIRWQEGLRLQQRRRSGKRMPGSFICIQKCR